MAYDRLDQHLKAIDGFAFAARVTTHLETPTTTAAQSALENLKQQYPNLIAGIDAFDAFAEQRGYSAYRQAEMAGAMLAILMAVTDVADVVGPPDS